MIKAGAGAVHMEDQVGRSAAATARARKSSRSDEMADRVKAAVDARTDPAFVVMARTDALAVEGLDAAIERAVAYVEAGADMIFPEAMTDLAMYKRFRRGGRRAGARQHHRVRPDAAVHDCEELASAGVDIVLYLLLGVSAR